MVLWPLWPTLAIPLSLVLTDSNFTLLTFPVNVTSWSLSLRSALNHSLTGQLTGLYRSFEGFMDLARNGSIGCSSEGEQCLPGTPSCCPAFNENDTELTCQPHEGSYYCRSLGDSEELAQRRLDDLEYGDSKGVLNSHPWTDDWGFQSKSAIEQEEELAAEEALWKKNWIPNPEENIWQRTYGKLKHNGREIWNDIRKLKKLRELKEKLIGKYKARLDKIKEEERGKERGGKGKTVMYPDEDLKDENAEIETDAQHPESDESFIKFSDEMPKKEKKIEFRLDDIIKDAVNLVGKKVKKTLKPFKEGEHTPDGELIYPKSFSENPININEIEDTKDKLKKEIDDLKVLRKIKKHPQLDDKRSTANEANIDELIRSQVNAILEEERKLDKLRKIEELRRLEQGMIKKKLR